LRGGVSYLT